jgi:hypothetical protein
MSAVDTPAGTRVPDYAEASVRTFYDRVQMMVLAACDKRRERPLLVMADGLLEREGWMSAYVPDDGRAHPEPRVPPDVRELARHAAEAWRRWTKLEPDEVVLTLRVYQLGPYVSVTIVPRTAEVVRLLEETVRTTKPLAAPPW